MIGQMVVDGFTFEITQIRLTHGGIVLTAVRPGPLPRVATTSRACTVFGEDGVGVYQVDIEIGWPKVSKGGICTVEAPLTIAEAISGGDNARFWSRGAAD